MRGLYLHIPFCEKKCIYCDFYSLETLHQQAEFVETLQMEIALRAAQMPEEQRRCDTVFFGGGTPSLLSAEQMRGIIRCLQTHFYIADDAEWTMECNPGTVTAATLREYRTLGINRVSFGVQSFFESDLRFLSRIHTPEEAHQALRFSRDAGFDNINLDLMFALPGQSLEAWRANLETAVRLNTDHISAYSLIFEPGTPLHAMLRTGKVQEQHEDNDAEMYDCAITLLQEHGFEQYEVSNFARNEQYCRHNCIYWQGDEYVSFGPSAHGYLGNTRYWNARSLKRYTEAVRAGTLPITNSETLSRQERMFERAFLELRARGIRIQQFQRDFGISIDDILATFLNHARSEGLIQHHASTPDIIKLTPKGYAVCDAISAEVIRILEQHSGTKWVMPTAEVYAGTTNDITEYLE